MGPQPKNVVITGSSQGFGAALAKRFARGGCRVFVNCAREMEKARVVSEEINARGETAEVFLCDLADEAAVQNGFAELQAKWGGVDILINNARLDPYRQGPDISEGEWFDRTLAVNLKGAYLATLAVFEGMKARKWGRVVNVSSVWAHWPAPRKMIPYSVSKAGMHALTRAFGLEGAPFQVTVNTVAPGLILTENASARLSPDCLRAETAAVPLGRGASPEEVAEVIWGVTASPFITGETINVNGGAWMGN